MGRNENKMNQKQYTRRLIIDNDGGDSQCGGGSYEEFCSVRMKDYIGLGATTLFYTTRSSGFSVFTHRTKYGTIFTSNMPHFKNVNAVSQMIAQGEDTLSYSLRFCREHGLEFFWQMRMNDTHDSTGADYCTYSYYSNSFKIAHPECLLGKHDQAMKHGMGSAVNYAHPLVRKMACLFIEEVCQNYDIDGIQLDFFRHPVIFPHPSEDLHASEEEIGVLTEMMHQIRAIVDREGEIRGRKILLSARVPDSVEYALFLGMDIQNWLASGLLDILTTGSYLQLNNFAYAAELGHKYGVPVYPSLDEVRIQDDEAKARRNARDAVLGRIESALDDGCDGVLLFNYFGIHRNDDFGEAERETVRIAADDARRKKADKTFIASVLGRGAVAGGAPPHDAYMNIPSLSPRTPIAVENSASVIIRLPKLGEQEKARLHLWFADDTSGSVRLNGAELGKFYGRQTVLEISPSALCHGDNTVLIAAEHAVLTDAAITFTR